MLVAAAAATATPGSYLQLVSARSTSDDAVNGQLNFRTISAGDAAHIWCLARVDVTINLLSAICNLPASTAVLCNS
ncbi:unnamed protein product [Gongylonema pulchrum]|uniref:Secreted protein n=1 Tax=Gongylonema pulchrum TaxID=637853 RepID=A0A183DWU2_9BILA|nr:unnamed protein product [Gongylonema pulchrum]